MFRNTELEALREMNQLMRRVLERIANGSLRKDEMRQEARDTIKSSDNRYTTYLDSVLMK